MEERSPLDYKTGGTERCGAVHITARKTCQGRAGRASGQGLHGILYGHSTSKLSMGHIQVQSTWYLDPGPNYLGYGKTLAGVEQFERGSNRQGSGNLAGCSARNLGAPLSCQVLFISWAPSRYHSLTRRGLWTLAEKAPWSNICRLNG